MFLLQAALVKAVQDIRDGRVDLSLSQTVQAAVPYLLPVAAAGILAAIGITVGLFLIIVPGLILLTFWCLIVPFIVIGESGPIDAFSKSWRTVRGYAWNVFGTLVLVFLLYLAFIIVLALILVFLPTFVRSFMKQRRGGHPGRAVPGPGDHAHLLPPDRRPRQPALHHHRPRTGHGLGAPLPHDPGRLHSHPASAPSAPRVLHRPRAFRSPGPGPQGRHAAVLHAAGTPATGPHGARSGHPAGLAPSAAKHPLTRGRTGPFTDLDHDHVRLGDGFAHPNPWMAHG